MKKVFSLSFIFVCALMVLCGCSTQYNTDVLTVYVDRANLEDVPAEEISSQSIDIKQMKNEKKMNIGIVLTVVNASQERARLENVAQFLKQAKEYAESYLAQVKAYRVTVFPAGVTQDKLMSGKDFDGVKYPFLLDMTISLNSEIEQRYDYDEAMYKSSIVWKLIDNRTKSNGLGENDAPYIKETLTSQNVTSRKVAIGGVSGRRMAGSERSNAINAYFVTLQNALIEFEAQLANRIPFGGKISNMRNRDGKIIFTLKAGREQGVVPKMQMLIVNEDGDQIAIATTTGGGKATESNLIVWRWLSESLKKDISAVAGNKSKALDYLDQEGNALYAICLGMPTPPKDKRTKIEDFKR